MNGKFYFIFLEKCSGCEFWKANFHRMFTNFLDLKKIPYEEISPNSNSFPFGKPLTIFSWAPVFVYVPSNASSAPDILVYGGQWDGKKFVTNSNTVPNSTEIEEWLLSKISSKTYSGQTQRTVSTVKKSDSGLW